MTKKKPPPSDSMERFNELMRGLLTVSKADLEKREEIWKSGRKRSKPRKERTAR